MGLENGYSCSGLLQPMTRCSLLLRVITPHQLQHPLEIHGYRTTCSKQKEWESDDVTPREASSQEELFIRKAEDRFCNCAQVEKQQEKGDDFRLR